MKYILILLILTTGCQTIRDHRADRKKNWLKRYGYLYNDTTILPGDSAKGETIIERDTAYIDSVLNSIRDTCLTKKQVRTISEKIPCRIQPIDIDSSRYRLKIWTGNGVLKYDLQIYPSVVPVLSERCPEQTPWYYLYIAGFASGVVFLVLGMLILQKK